MDMVYFILCNNDFVRIGFSDDVTRRLANLKSGNPYPLRLIGVLDGDKKREKLYHCQYINSRSHGDWFRLTEDIQQFMTRRFGWKQPSKRKFQNR